MDVWNIPTALPSSNSLLCCKIPGNLQTFTSTVDGLGFADYIKVLAHGDPTTQTCRRLDSLLKKLRDHARRPDSATFPPENYKLTRIIRLEPRKAKHERTKLPEKRSTRATTAWKTPKVLHRGEAAYARPCTWPVRWPRFKRRRGAISSQGFECRISYNQHAILHGKIGSKWLYVQCKRTSYLSHRLVNGAIVGRAPNISFFLSLAHKGGMKYLLTQGRMLV